MFNHVSLIRLTDVLVALLLREVYSLNYMNRSWLKDIYLFF
jgi:hypothetical protein